MAQWNWCTGRVRACGSEHASIISVQVASRYEHSSFFLHMGIAAHWQPPAPRRHVVCLLQEHRPTLLENTELVVDAFRVAGRYLCAHRLASALEAGGKHAGMRKWENICKAMKQPAAFGPQLFKEHLQQHAAVIITALRRKDAGRPCDVAGRPLPAGARLSSADAAERPAGAIASCARSHRRGGSKSISKPQDASRPLSLEDAAAAQARAQAAMDELLLEEEVGGPDPVLHRPSAALPAPSYTDAAFLTAATCVCIATRAIILNSSIDTLTVLNSSQDFRTSSTKPD